MGCSPWDRAHKDSIRTPLVSGRGARTIGKSSVRNIPGDVFRQYYYLPFCSGTENVSLCKPGPAACIREGCLTSKLARASPRVCLVRRTVERVPLSWRGHTAQP
eukprot:517023-Pelagomonas_calceolata.AAC.1